MSESAPAQELGGLVKRGVGWTMASQGVLQVVALLTSVVIARFLTPRQVGLASEAVVFVTLALLLVEFGVASVIVQRPELSDVETSTLFWAGIALGVFLTLAGVALSGLIADLYGQPRVQALFAVLSLTFVASAPGMVQGALLTRELRFRSLELRTIAATLSSCTTTIVLAVLGAGPWAIVGQTLAMSSVSTALLWRSSSWRPRRLFSMEVIREYGGFASQILGARMLGWANSNLDNFLVGRFLGAAPLGSYSLAFGIALSPVNRIAIPITQVFFPAFSRLRERQLIGEVWLRAVRMLAFFVAPAMFGLIVIAPDLVVAVFGARWHHAAPVMQILAVIALLQTLTALHDGILQALAQTRALFRFWLLLSVATLVGFAAGLPWGITGVATGYLVVSLALQPVFVWITVRIVGISVRAWLRSVAGVFEAALVMLAVIDVARRLLVDAHVVTGARLGVLVALGILAYVPAAVVLAPEAIGEIRRTLDRRRTASPQR